MVTPAQTTPAVAGRERRRRRRSRLGPLLFWLIVMLALGWVVYWYVVYRVADGYIGTAGAAPATLACADRQFGGFPLWMTLDCREPVAVSSAGGRASLGYFRAEAPLYNPGFVQAAMAGPFAYDGVNHTVRADWGDAQLEVLAGLDGIVRGVISFSDAQLTVTDFVDAVIWAATATAWSTEFHAAEGEPNALRLALATTDLAIELGGVAYPNLTGTATLTLLEAGDRIDRDPAAVAGDWLSTGGAFRIDHMEIASGDVIAEITGELSLGLDGTLSGTVTMRYSGEDLPTLVAAIFPWLAEDAALVADALRALSRPIEMRGVPAHEVNLNLDRGVVRVGLIPIPNLTIPSVGPLDHLVRPAQ